MMAKKESIRVSRLLELRSGFHAVLRDECRGDNFLPDLLFLKDSEVSPTKLITDLESRLDSETYTPKQLVRMEVPKNNFCVRPAARPAFDDWIVYYACALYVARKTDRLLFPGVFSARLSERKNNLLPGAAQWLKFQDRFWHHFKRGYKYVVKTDITSYYVNISLEKLTREILTLLQPSSKSDAVTNLLFHRVLDFWSQAELNKGFGLPQGIKASSILANLFLNRVDSVLSVGRDRRYVRYMDDIRILARTEFGAKKALRDLILVLRELGLEVNAKKTEVLSPTRVLATLRDPKQDDIDFVETALQEASADSIPGAVEILTDILQEALKQKGDYADRHLRFSANRFIQLAPLLDVKTRKKLSQMLLKRLRSSPGHAYIFSRLLTSLSIRDSNKEIISFIRSKDNIYEWQELFLLDTLLRCGSLGRREVGLAWRVARDKDRHPLCRAKAIVLIGKYGNLADRRQLSRMFIKEETSEVKRAILVGVQELPTPDRNPFYAQAKRTSPEHTALLDYLKRRQEPLYHEPYEGLSPIQLLEEEEY